MVINAREQSFIFFFHKEKSLILPVKVEDEGRILLWQES